MKFGIFYEHQLPRPWKEGDELKLFQDALEQVEVADRVGIEYAWEVEHHFLEEYSHSSAPEVFLAACASRTKNIRLGQGIGSPEKGKHRRHHHQVDLDRAHAKLVEVGVPLQQHANLVPFR